jgi:hypothetical protein
VPSEIDQHAQEKSSSFSWRFKLEKHNNATFLQKNGWLGNPNGRNFFSSDVSNLTISQ